MRFKAFTIIELVVVLGIIGLVGTLGIYGMVTFRRVVQTREAANELIGVAKETRNMAKNNTITKDADTDNYVYAWSLTFDETSNQLKRYLCRQPIGTSTPTVWTCPATTGATVQPLKSVIFSDVNYDLTQANSCKRIIFENLTGDLLASVTTNTNNYSYTGECRLRLTHRESPQASVGVFFNPLNNTFGLTSD